MAKARFTLDGEVGEIVIADPPLNLFGLELVRDLARATDEARASGARAILVRAEGDNFSAGANVEIFIDRDESAARELIEEFIPVDQALRRDPGSHRRRGARALPGGRIGGRAELRPDLGGGGHPARAGRSGHRRDAVRRRNATSRRPGRSGPGGGSRAERGVYPAETMLEWGVVNRVVPAATAREGARVREQLAAGPTLAHAATKRMIRLTVEEGVDAADAALPEEGAKVMASDDLQNGARTLLEKGPGHATFTGK